MVTAGIDIISIEMMALMSTYAEWRQISRSSLTRTKRYLFYIAPSKDMNHSPASNLGLTQYTAPDGTTYDVIGSFHATSSWTDDTMWDVDVPVGITSGFGALRLEYYAWNSLMKPMLEGLYVVAASATAETRQDY